MNEYKNNYINDKQLERDREDVEERKEYEKPFFKLEEIMNFPFDMINSKGYKISCRQCSSCHGCR